MSKEIIKEKSRSIKLNNSEIKFIILLDFALKKILSLNALIIIFLLLAIIVSLIINSMPSIKQFGLSFFYGKIWDPYFEKFAALPFIISTLLTSFLAVIICIPFALALAILLGEYFTEGIISSLLKSAIEWLAAIPSVIYGLWGLLILVPKIQALETKIGVEAYGVGILPASIILAIMIIPYAASISRDTITMVPADLKEAAYSLGATRFEVLRRIVLPYAYSGILAGILLSMGRALGETMAVTMVIGNSNIIPKNIFSPANTIASLIANEFTEATGELYLSSLFHIGLWLFFITIAVNIIGKFIIKKIFNRNEK